jgi:formate dehydrogenase
MKNVGKLRGGGAGPTCLVHPDDAAGAGLDDGRRVRIVSPDGATEAVAELSPTVLRGTVSLPHGWGRRVRVDGSDEADGGPDYNALTASGPGSVEPLSGMSVLSGIRVRIECADA